MVDLANNQVSRVGNLSWGLRLTRNLQNACTHLNDIHTGLELLGVCLDHLSTFGDRVCNGGSTVAAHAHQATQLIGIDRTRVVRIKCFQ